MELPKNITQIGEINHSCKIYIEDYVFSYINQYNEQAADKEIAIALYGERKTEGDVVYFFLYGASRIHFMPRETRHLSQAVLQDAEKQRKKFFPAYSFWGYLMLTGEMIEGIHIYEQGVGRYVPGFARFYEQNDTMLNFLLEERAKRKPEEISLEKYEAARKRQEQRRTQAVGQEEPPRRMSGSWDNRARLARERYRDEKRKGTEGRADGKFRVAVACACLCVVGFALRDEWQGKVGQTVSTIFRDAMEKQLPDAGYEAAEQNRTDTLVAEDRLADAVLEENKQQPVLSDKVEIAEAEPERTEEEKPPIGTEEVPAPSAEPEGKEEPSAETQPPAAQEETASAGQESLPQTEPAATPEPVKYVIQKGDTLTSICMLRYGTDDRLQEVCAMNGIRNPDDIKEGAKILLP